MNKKCFSSSALLERLLNRTPPSRSFGSALNKPTGKSDFLLKYWARLRPEPLSRNSLTVQGCSFTQAMPLLECFPFSTLVDPRKKVRDPAQGCFANGKASTGCRR